jgi:uncharacterized protein YjbI with pentapeptide repeats
MNQKLRLGLSTLSLALLGTAAHAENPDHMRQLLSTGDCPGCDLSNAFLIGLDLPNANLQGANLSGAKLQDIQLTRANLESANLSGASFSITTLTGANLTRADLSNASTIFVCTSNFFDYLEGIEGIERTEDAEEIDTCVSKIVPRQLLPELCAEVPEIMETINILRSDSQENICNDDTIATLYSADATTSWQLWKYSLLLNGANLSGANLHNADLSGADLSYATLNDADAADANFDYTRLINADVSELKNADLSKAWKTWQALGEWLLATQKRAQDRSHQESGRSDIFSMSFEQAYYYQTTGKFSQSAVGTPDDNDVYHYGIVDTGRIDMAYQYALSKTGDSPSFLGVVLLEADADGTSVPSIHLCESEAVTAMAEPSQGIAPLNLPTIEAPDGFFSCPAGWKLID